MATMIQTPDSLSLLMNLKSFIVSSTTDISFAMSCSGETIVEESYTPDGNGRIEIQVRDLVARFLETGLPSSNQYVQTSAVRTFSASVNGNAVSTFTVVNGGVRKLSVTPELFLKANWLTWQPQTKRVGWSSPEYLSYYFVDAGTVKAKFYYKAGGTKVVTVASGTAGQLQTFNMAMSRLFSVGDVSEDDVYGLVDVWVETGAGVQLSYVQRYVFAETQGDEHVYLAVNALGGIDTFTFHGERKVAPDVAHDSAELGDTKIDITAGAVRHWEQNTGHLGTEESSWIYELISSKRAWAVLDGQAEAIVIDADSNEYSDLETLSAGTFSYYLSEEGGLQSIGRETGQLPVIEVPSPAGEIFFLEARLIDYPDADLSENLLLLVQSPFSRAWYRLDLGSTLDWIYSSVVTSPIGQMAHEHENLLTLGQLSESSGRLTYRGEALARLSDIPNIPAPTPAEHWFDPVMDDEDEQVVGMKALFDMYIVQTAADEEEGTDEEQKNISEILRHLRLETVGEVQYLATDISFYSDQAVSAGGISEGGGGGTGGGITADGMWALLAASTQEQIDASHLSQALGGYATQAWVLAQGLGTITKESIIEALEYTPVAPDDLLPFASGLASAASRLDALEYWLTRPVLEDLALTSLHVDRTIDLGGLVLEYDYTNDAWHLNGNFYADGFVSAGGMSSTGSGTGGGIDANAMWTILGDGTQEQIHSSHLADALSDYALKTWVAAQGYLVQSQMWAMLDAPSGERIDASHLALSLGTGGNYISNVSLATNETTGKKILTFSRGTLPTYVSRVAMSVPTGFSVSGSPITSSGTLALSFSSGYSLPTTAKQSNWDTAYGWGDHAQAGYAKADSLMAVSTATAGATARLRALEYWLTRPVLEDLKLTSLHVERTIDLGGLTLEYDYAVSAWHLKGNIYADGFVSAGGYSGSSSEGGINTTAMWQLLAAATSEQISASHLSTALNGYATQEWVRAQGYSLTAEAIAIALNYVPVAPDDLVTLAAADATAAARISAIEYWLTRPVLEDLALTALHVDRTIDLGGLVLEYDYTNNAWHLKGNIYADGFVSAGGMSATASGGGISATAMWNLLDDATTEQINASHLSTALATYATQAWVQALGYTTATNMWQLLAAATSEQIAASHLPISVSQGSGSYVTGISYSGGTFSVSRANISIPTLLPNPYALSFGSRSYDGSAARTITAADLGAITGNQAITLAGDVMGSGTTYITTTIGTGVVTNAMLAGSIANGKLANSSISLAGRSVSLGGSITASAMRSDLSISNVENTALSSWAGTTNITKVGTITTGTWHGSAIANSYLANSSITLAGRSVSLGGSITAANMLSDLGLSGVVGDISTLQGYFTSGKANYAVADGDGNTISSTYLKLSGGTMTGDLHMGSSYGRRIYFGDGSYCYIGELSDDVMSIYGDKGINILTASSSRAVSVGSSSVATPLYVYGRLYLTASAYLEYSSSAIHATAGFYSDSFISAGGISTSSDARLKEDIEGISATKAWTVLAGLRPVTFRWKVDHRRAAGYIAQEVERVLPEAVTETGGIKRLQYDILFTYGMAALGGLRLQQETQEQKIARLERRVEYLERRIGLAV